MLVRFIGAAVAVMAFAAPAHAQAVPAAPALLDIGLLGAGVVGLLVGRRGGRSRHGGDGE